MIVRVFDELTFHDGHSTMGISVQMNLILDFHQSKRFGIKFHGPRLLLIAQLDQKRSETVASHECIVASTVRTLFGVQIALIALLLGVVWLGSSIDFSILVDVSHAFQLSQLTRRFDWMGVQNEINVVRVGATVVIRTPAFKLNQIQDEQGMRLDEIWSPNYYET